MGVWEESPFGRTGAQLNIQDALTAIDRVLRDGQIERTTQTVLENARSALVGENA